MSDEDLDIGLVHLAIQHREAANALDDAIEETERLAEAHRRAACG